MKRVFMWILSISIGLFSMAGCGGTKALSVVCSGSGILFNGSVVGLTEWGGSRASHKVDEQFTVTYYICENGPDDCPHNNANVLPENMSAKKKAKYYALYFDTYVYMFYPCGDYWMEGVGILGEEGRYSKQQMVEYMYNDMSMMVLTDNVESIKFADTVEIDLSSWEFKVRPTEVVIPGVLRVKLDDASVKMTGSKKLGNIVVTTASSANYDYYKYKDVLVQISTGIDVAAYIKFLE